MINLAQIFGVSERDAEVIAHYMGYNGKEKLSVEQIVRKFNITEIAVKKILYAASCGKFKQLTRHYR